MSDIRNSTDYKKFKIFEENREIDPVHLYHLKERIKENNLLDCYPIIINENWFIVDGQHRFQVAVDLKIPIFFIQKEGLTIDDIPALNTISKGWKLPDYHRFWIKRGKEDYRKLDEFSRKFSLSLPNAMVIVQMANGGRATASYGLYKSGQWEMGQVEDAADFAHQLNEITVFTEGNTSRDRDFVRSLYVVYDQFEVEHEDLVEKLKISGTVLVRKPTRIEYLRQFEDVYNYRATGQRTRFY